MTATPDIAPHRESVVAPVPLADLTAALPPPWRTQPAELAALVAAGRRLVVLDDDPTGTQTIADLPVLTSWSVADLRWALQQPTTSFFVLTNTRSLAPPDAVRRNQEIIRALGEASRAEGVDVVVASRGDSTLRGYYPLETDTVVAELSALGTDTDAVVIVPAYFEPGRITIDAVHWMSTDAGMIPVAQSEFADDASFGYHHSDLRSWVQEKTDGRVLAADVVAITLQDLRVGGPDRVYAILRELTGKRTVVVDAVSDDDLAVLVAALVRAESEGKHFVYRTGPSFVRVRSGQQASAPIGAARIADIARQSPAVAADTRSTSQCGIVVVGSHVGLTTRQLDRLRATGRIVELELDVPVLLDPGRAADHVTETAQHAVSLLRDPASSADVVIRTSRSLVTGADAADSLVIARTVSAALVSTVRTVVAAVRPAFVVAKGGITSSDTATAGLAIARAWSRGTLLPGIVSLWEPVAGPAAGVPYIVFAGNVGDDDSLADVVETLRRVHDPDRVAPAAAGQRPPTGGRA